jgi:2-polyprenyl-3-methyl-5-hydroxy-6-metoxy-1,4-benzoquinol methylase/uncharacterized protein YbaR (Trm112 family)
MPLSTDFLNLLVHPIRKTPLTYSPELNTLGDEDSDDVFDIKDGVPILLTSELNSALAITERHKQAGTQFRYKEHYQNDAVAYDYTEEAQNPIEREEINRLRQNILSQVPSSAEWILDTGCGGGWLAKAIAPKGQKVISMDISDINPIRAVKNVPVSNHYGLVADVFELPLNPNSIDCIVASEIIEHVPDPGKFLQELYNILKPGGRVVVTTPYNELIRTTLCIHCNQLTPHNAHLHSFTEHSMKRYIPKGAKSSMKVFNSKLMVKAHVQKTFSFLPTAAWDAIDKIGITVTGKKAYRLMTIIEK